MGKLIVFEGTDGTGKSTQFALLTKRLQSENIPFRRLQFPQYLEPSSALIRMYLNGEFGDDPNSVNAYAASTFYAVDRYASYQRVWKDDYAAGGLILSDRYTTSNAVHQGGKLEGAAREEFFSWLYDLEFCRMGLPKPDHHRLNSQDMRKSLKNMDSLSKAYSISVSVHYQGSEKHLSHHKIGSLLSESHSADC